MTAQELTQRAKNLDEKGKYLEKKAKALGYKQNWRRFNAEMEKAIFEAADANAKVRESREDQMIRDSSREYARVHDLATRKRQTYLIK